MSPVIISFLTIHSLLLLARNGLSSTRLDELYQHSILLVNIVNQNFIFGIGLDLEQLFSSS